MARERVEHFDPLTTFEYLNKLGKQFGTIYVNDAPLASLTTSNSVAEIKCGRKVMGAQMTGVVRKLCQFFMKTFPLDVTARHIPKPLYAEYFSEKFTAVIRGQCRNQTDIMDRILLANSLLD